jgi:hypothetical protein
VRDGTLGRVRGLAETARGPVRPGERPVRQRQSGVIGTSFEHRDRVTGFVDDPRRRRGIGTRVGVHERQHQARLRRDDVVLCVLDRLLEVDAGPREFARLHERLAEIGKQLQPSGVVLGKQSRRAAEKICGGGHVAAPECSSARGRELVERAHAELVAVVVERTELRQEAVRLLEVVAEDLLVLGAVAVAVHALAPIGKALVQAGAVALQQSAVDGVADQDVLEAEGILLLDGRPIGPDELLSRQCIEQPAHLVAERVCDEFPHGGAREDEADHRCGVDHGALLGDQLVEASGEQGLDRGRDHDLGDALRCDPAGASLPDDPLVDHHRQKLLDEERVALGGIDDALAHLGLDPDAPEEVVHDPRRVPR